MKRKLLVGTALVVTALAFLALATLTPVIDLKPSETSYFQTTNQRLDSLSKVPGQVSGDTLRVGWSKVNLTPSFDASLAGYGISAFSDVRDSVWMRAFYFDNGQQQLALLAPDLLIFPPAVKNKLNEQLNTLGLQGIQYTATHTHHSLGNWHPGLVGRMFAGPYQDEAVAWIEEKSIEAIVLARANLARTRVGYAAVQAEDLVYNRLVNEMGTIDPWIRFMLLQKDSGEAAVIASFAAHATTVPRELNHIHRDYPGVLMDQLEKNELIDFAAFVAGAMGSQGPAGDVPYEQLTDHLGNAAAEQVGLLVNMLRAQYTTTLNRQLVEIELGVPQYRVSNWLRLRPWAFSWLFGDYQGTVSTLRIGDNLLVGTPCDFSGELVRPLDSLARSQNLNLMITSFNGDYVGYITKDSHYELDAYETRVMNWFGPGNGAYFSHVIKRLIGMNTPVTVNSKEQRD